MKHSKELTIKQCLATLIEKLDAVKLALSNQESLITNFQQEKICPVDTGHLLIAQQKSLRTTFEILRDEIEELMDIVILTCGQEKNGVKEGLNGDSR